MAYGRNQDWTTLKAKDPESAPAKGMAEAGVSVVARFIPWSQVPKANLWEHESDPKNAKDPSKRSIHYLTRVLDRRGSVILESPFAMGSGNLPAAKLPVSAVGRGMTLNRAAAYESELETGYRSGRLMDRTNAAAIWPEAESVLSCLLLDATAIDSGSFEEWARDLGYDTDSRKAESIYRVCLEHGLKLRNALSDPVLTKLREAFADY